MSSYDMIISATILLYLPEATITSTDHHHSEVVIVNDHQVKLYCAR